MVYLQISEANHSQFLTSSFSAWFAFLLPSYATFKALSHRPLSEPELQRWTMYWSVVGAFVAFEYAAEWLISWYVSDQPF